MRILMYSIEFYHMIEPVMMGPHAGATNVGNSALLGQLTAYISHRYNVIIILLFMINLSRQKLVTSTLHHNPPITAFP